MLLFRERLSPQYSLWQDFKIFSHHTPPPLFCGTHSTLSLSNTKSPLSLSITHTHTRQFLYQEGPPRWFVLFWSSNSFKHKLISLFLLVKPTGRRSITSSTQTHNRSMRSYLPRLTHIFYVGTHKHKLHSFTLCDANTHSHTLTVFTLSLPLISSFSLFWAGQESNTMNLFQSPFLMLNCVDIIYF